ncbi:hypothetical protein MNB_SM-5-628 [hydrothermal vent metagenome]|uniref:Lipoprotein n=1 Tax=hydrothermal vent metagenome TaxID=652676 RepID=A0A1W1CJC2_9ZZZZ
MYKILAVIAVVLLMSGCANFKVTGTMCDNIEQKPGMPIPQECQEYSKKKAEKAFFNRRNKQIESAEDIIEFSKESGDDK